MPTDFWVVVVGEDEHGMGKADEPPSHDGSASIRSLNHSIKGLSMRTNSALNALSWLFREEEGEGRTGADDHDQTMQ